MITAIVLTIFSLGFALISEEIRANWTGKTIKVVYRTDQLDKEDLLLEILNSKGFCKEGVDRPYEGKNYNYGEVQGSLSLRTAAAKVAQNQPSMMDPSELRKLQELDEKLFRILQFKRIGHAFALKGDIALPEGEVALVGFSETYTIPMIAASFKQFIETQDLSDWTDEDTSQIMAVFRNMLFEETMTPEELTAKVELINKKDKENMAAFAMGYLWHVTVGAFVDDFFICANRGNGALAYGVEIFKAPSSPVYTSNDIAQLTNRHTLIDGETLSIYNHFQTRGWQRLEPLKMSSQKVGNCGYTSAKGLLRSLLSWRYYCKSKDAAHPLAFAEKTKALYKAWSQFDRELVLKDFLLDVKAINAGDYSGEYKKAIHELYGIISSSLERKQLGRISDSLYQEFLSEKISC